MVSHRTVVARMGLYGLLAIGVWTSPALAQGRAPVRVGKPVLEERLEPTQVSSPLAENAIYGFVRGTPGKPVSFPAERVGDPTLYVEGLGRAAQKVCVDVARAQGGYTATFNVLIPKGIGPGVVGLDSSDEVRDYMAGQHPTSGELAIRAYLATKGICLPSSSLLIGSWNSGADDEPIYLAVGGFGMGRPHIGVEDAPAEACDGLGRLLGRPGFGANVFGAYCRVVMPTGSCKASTRVKVFWVEGGVSTPPVRLQLLRDCHGK